MAKIQSYLDTTLRIIHINRRSALPQEVIEAMREYMEHSETSSPIRREFIRRHLKAEHHTDKELHR